MARPDSFHRFTDGRGSRLAYVNGNEVECVFWCDSAQGIAVFSPRPTRINRARDGIYTRRLRGSVTVEQTD